MLINEKNKVNMLALILDGRILSRHESATVLEQLKEALSESDKSRARIAPITNDNKEVLLG